LGKKRLEIRRLGDYKNRDWRFMEIRRLGKKRLEIGRIETGD